MLALLACMASYGHTRDKASPTLWAYFPLVHLLGRHPPPWLKGSTTSSPNISPWDINLSALQKSLKVEEVLEESSTGDIIPLILICPSSGSRGRGSWAPPPWPTKLPPAPPFVCRPNKLDPPPQKKKKAPCLSVDHSKCYGLLTPVLPR